MSTESQMAAERINLVYRSSSSDGEKDVELPFRLLVMGPFSGDSQADYFDDQEVININNDNFSNVMVSMSPSVSLMLPDMLTESYSAGEDDVIEFNFAFKSIADFSPQKFIDQSETLSLLGTLRNDLLAIREKSTGDADLSTYLESLASDGLAAKFIAYMCEERPMTMDVLDECIIELDERMSDQLDLILHHADFREIESLWRSLYFLVERTRFDENCVIEILNISKTALQEDLEDAPELVKSQFYNTVYSKEFGQFGGKPYSCLLGNFRFGPGPSDIKLLQQIAAVASMAHAPFLAAPSPALFDVDSFSELVRLRDLAANFEQPRFVKWNSFRQSEDARYVGLVLPGFLLRPTYGESNEIGLFPYQERTSKNDKGLWGNAAFAFATRLLDSFATTRWCMNITGSEHGKVAGLHMQSSSSVATKEKKIPTEVLISDRRESELMRWGFIPLTVHKGEDNAAFYGASSVQALREFPNEEDGKKAALDFQLGSQLPYLYIVSRLSHYIKMMQREHIGSWKIGPEIEKELNNWVRQYVSDMDNPAPNVRVRRPLRDAKVEVKEVDGKSDWYMVSLKVIPHLKYMGAQFTLNEVGKLDKY